MDRNLALRSRWPCLPPFGAFRRQDIATVVPIGRARNLSAPESADHCTSGSGDVAGRGATVAVENQPFFFAFAFWALRASRYFLISALGRSLCLAQTIPKTGAARLLQPGTGQSWIGPLRRLRMPTTAPLPGGRPGPLNYSGRRPPTERLEHDLARARHGFGFDHRRQSLYELLNDILEADLFGIYSP